MRRALIGHTGFVGSNLAAGGGFSDLYNSANIGSIAGESFDEIVCAGVSAVKWLANKDPERDWAGIERLLEPLAKATARRLTLISTIDVYPDPAQPLDESFDPTGAQNHAYGRHRLAVEAFARTRFDDVLVARLPALFGRGLKKNFIFDLLTDNETAKINPASCLQWYPLDRLAGDLQTARKASLPLVNLFPQPVATVRLVETLFPGATIGAPSQPAPTYDLRTRHAGLFGGPEGYLLSGEAVLAAITTFVDAARADPQDVLGR